jgi:beta-xylosidase
LIEGIEGIDPDLAWDDEGVAIVTYSGLVTTGEDFGHHGGIRQVDVDLVAGRALAEPRNLWSGGGGIFPEAPHLYHRGGYWYLMIAEGGTERGHGESIARSTDPRGGFEAGPHNPFISARSTDRPVQNTGHGDLVETPDGTVMVLLGVRPRGATRAFSALGRETFATRVTWDAEGWPVAEPVTLAPRTPELAQSWDYAAPLSREWIAIRRTPAELADLETAPASLTLHGEGTDMTSVAPVFLGRRQLTQTATIRVSVDASAGSGGIAVRYDEWNVYSLTATQTDAATTIVAEARVPGIVQRWERRLPAGPVELIIRSQRPVGETFESMMTSDLVELAARSGDTEVVLATVDGRSLSAEVAASFTGRVIGVFAVTGSVVFGPIDYSGSEA